MSDELTAIFPELIDSTMRNDYVSCEIKFEYARSYGLSAKGGSVHLIAGGAFAKGVEVVRKLVYRDGMELMDALVQGVLAAWTEYGAFEPGDKYVAKSAERVAYALVEYFTEYPPTTDKIQPYYRADGKPAIEFEFSFPLETLHPETGNPLLYGGRFDMVGEYLSSLWVVDEKTATRLGPQWLRSFTLRGQLLGYVYAAKSFGLPVNGFIVRGLSFLRDYYGHAEVVEVVPEYRLEQWREQIEIDAARMVKSYQDGRFSWALGEACNAYGGCPFKSLCDKQHWQEWWQQYFEIDYWNPLDRSGRSMDSQKSLADMVLAT
ncbi:MAG: PD-(D/E)XK nuclease family protein [Gammaproteobacteria bacterium]|nr:PD-(D/E)XK nuclease family protein [Gammaproteobacteria bacterium]